MLDKLFSTADHYAHYGRRRLQLLRSLAYGVRSTLSVKATLAKTSFIVNRKISKARRKADAEAKRRDESNS